MPESPDYRYALGHVFDAVRGHDHRGAGAIALNRLRTDLSRAMDAESIETVLQSMVQDGLLTPARQDGTVALTAAGLKTLRRSDPRRR